MSKPKKPGAAWKNVAHRAYVEALRDGQRPPRAATFTDRRKQASRDACRKFRYES